MKMASMSTPFDEQLAMLRSFLTSANESQKPSAGSAGPFSTFGREADADTNNREQKHVRLLEKQLEKLKEEHSKLLLTGEYTRTLSAVRECKANLNR